MLVYLEGMLPDAPLIVVDVQNGFVNPNSAHVVVPISRLIRERLDAGGTVIATRFLNPEGSQWERLIHWTRLRESPQTDLVPEVADAMSGPNAHVVDKCSYTSLTDEVKDLLATTNSDEVLVCGIASDGCVLKTAVDLFEMGHRPIVLKDLCASHAGNSIHEAGILLTSRFIGSDQVINSTLAI